MIALFASSFALLLIATFASLDQRGIATGFAFMGRAAGFDIGFKLIPYEATDSYGRAFLVGLTNTLFVSALGVVGGTILGCVVGLLRLSRSLPMSSLAACYVELLRNCPLLLHLFIWYFGVLSFLPGARNPLTLAESVYLNSRGLYFPTPESWLGVALGAPLAIAAFALAWRWGRREAWTPTTRRTAAGACAVAGCAAIYLMVALSGPLDRPRMMGLNFRGGGYFTPELMALFLALSLYSSAFIAEIVRGGILAVHAGQSEAAAALGLSRWNSIRLVVAPQALRIIVPPLTNQYVNITKLSSLAAAIAYPDLMQIFGKTTLNQTGQAVEVVMLTMAVYLAISLGTSAAMRWFNARIALRGGAL